MGTDDTPNSSANHELSRETLRQLREIREDVHSLRDRMDDIGQTLSAMAPTVAAVSGHPDRLTRVEERLSTVTRIVWGAMGVGGSAIVIEILNLILKNPVQH